MDVQQLAATRWKTSQHPLRTRSLAGLLLGEIDLYVTRADADRAPY
jgi:hypothetical protein